MSIAKTIFGLIGTAILGLFATYVTIPDWVLMNLRQHLWQTVGGFIISATFGGTVVFIAYATYIGRKLGDKPCKAFDDLKRIDGLAECKSLSDMVGPVRDLSSLHDKIAELKKRHEKAIADRDAKISELEKRPTQKAMDELKSAHVEEIVAKDAEIERLRSPVEAVRRAISGLPGNELAMVGTLRKGPLKTSGYVETLSHLASLGIAEKLKAPGVFTPTWGLTSSAIDALGEDERLSKSAADAAADGVRDLEAERYISSLISKLPEKQLGAVYVMHDRGFFDYRAVDRDPWSYEHDQGADDLEELRSAGIAEYRTLGNGMRRWTLTERAARVIDDDPTLVEEGRRYFDGVVGGGGS